MGWQTKCNIGWAGLGVEEPSELAAASSRQLSPDERKAIDSEHLKKSKALQYMADGQTYPPERAAGSIQFGMWLARPRVVREFRGHANKLAPIEPYWLETVRAVDRVWSNKTLSAFWRHGRLVANTAHESPYRTDIPERYKNADRWFALDTSLDSPRPWNMQTELPVFSLALVQGERGSRRWLLYAHAPIEERRGVEIRIPEYKNVSVDVPRAGAFYLLTEQDNEIRRIESDN